MIGRTLGKSSLSNHADLRELRGFELGPDGDLIELEAIG